MGPPPKGLDARKVEFNSLSGSLIRAWLIYGDKQKAAVILMHGVRADRRSMIGRARFLAENGYSVLLFDFQAHGESQGEQITFGYRESEDARAAVSFMRKLFPDRLVTVIGSSLGGVACLTGKKPVDADALVLEAVYPAIDEAVANRMEIYLGKPGRLLTPFLTMQLQWRIGISTRDLRPIDGIRKVRCPVFIIGGEADRRTPLNETECLYKNAAGPKKIWIVRNAGHVD
ncbi:MAG: alpha/beta hydrolase, partial [bacterium]|nr:alpha/beta hydrolase [bacterium]